MDGAERIETSYSEHATSARTLYATRQCASSPTCGDSRHIAVDQAMVAGALGALPGIERDLEVVATAADGQQALTLVRELKPDVLLTDIEMPVMTGLELAAAIGADTQGTIRNYLSDAISKIGGRNRVDAARIARQKGWL